MYQAMKNSQEGEMPQAARIFLRKFFFVTGPMWFAAVVLIFSDVKPAPAIDSSPVETPDGKSVNVKWLETQLDEAREAAKSSKDEVEKLKADLSGGISPLTAFFNDIPAQGALKFTFALVGLLHVVGPHSFIQSYQAACGSLFSALFIAGFWRVFSRQGDPYWMDAMGDLIDGSANWIEYFVFAFVWIFGMARWSKGWQFFELEEDEDDLRPLSKPLLKAVDP